MLKYIELHQAGPAGEVPLRMEFAPRLNIITGDNGLGKTFALDVAWWSLTRTWPFHRAWPRKGSGIKPLIRYQVESKTQTASPAECTFDFNTQTWTLPRGRKPMPGLVVYARVDGSFAVWDPARNYWREKESEREETLGRPSFYSFNVQGLWDGVEDKGSQQKFICNGLIRDWVTWQDRSSVEFRTLKQVLDMLSASEKERLRPGKPTRVWIEDSRDIPTLEMPYGTTPVTLAAAGIKRILGLAYLLVWAWSEHAKAAKLRNEETTARLVLLVDEVEAHLHPQWQRALLPSLLKVAGCLTPHERVNVFDNPLDDLEDEYGVQTQIIASTHSPMVMASVEPCFNVERDKLFTLDLSPQKNGQNANVLAREIPWAPQGDVVNWLVSEAFGLKQGRSREAERAVEAAEAFMRGDTSALPEDLRNKEAIDAELRRTVPGHDPFWAGWIVKTEGGE
jgi:hypothetical protein